MKVILTVPPEHKGKSPSLHGEHLAYDGRVGVVIAGTKDGAWVQFDKGYVGCPLAWLKAA